MHLTFAWSQLFGSWFEFVGFITGIFSVLLLIFTKNLKLQWWNWPASIISAAVYFDLFHKWTLYGNMALQIPFLVISLYGAWYWRGQLRGLLPINAKEVPTTYCYIEQWILALFLALIAEVPAYILLRWSGDVSPLWDGLIFTISIAAIYLQLRKYVQSWYLWVLVDGIAVPFHIYHHHGATGLLYLAYATMCIIGWWTWKQETRTNNNVQPLAKLVPA